MLVAVVFNSLPGSLAGSSSFSELHLRMFSATVLAFFPMTPLGHRLRFDRLSLLQRRSVVNDFSAGVISATGSMGCGFEAEVDFTKS
jgi:hypothetical protein